MAENKMAEVAKLFGKELGEEFFVKHPKQTEPFLAQFEHNGTWYICSYDGKAEWHYSETLLVQLLTGQAVIVDDQ